MSSRRSAANQGRWLAAGIRPAIGSEIRDARIGAGLSQRVAGAAAEMSHAQLGRIERGALSQVTVEQLARACAAVGLRLAVRAYPDGSPVRDAAHLALLGRLRRRLPPGTRWRTEVPLLIAGDGRAWDAVADLIGGELPIEAETRLHDLQAVDRRTALKCRDAGLDVVVLLVNDTAHNRRVLAVEREALRPRFPADGREVLQAVRDGRRPVRSGIVLL